MSYGVGFALLCLLLTGCNDVLFKRYSTRGHSRGMLILGVGLIWTFAQWSLAQIQETPIEFNNSTLIFGLMAGAFVTLSNFFTFRKPSTHRSKSRSYNLSLEYHWSDSALVCLFERTFWMV